MVILYWGLYLVSPRLVNGDGGLPWYSEFYLHLGTTLFAYGEAIWLNRAPKNTVRAIAPIALVGAAYLAWIELVVSRVNDSPCGLTTSVCGYPYPFLNDFSPLARGIFLTVACAVGLLLGAGIVKLWRQLSPADAS